MKDAEYIDLVPNDPVQEFVVLMNDDLKREYQHMLFYLHSSSLITGLHRHEISEFLFEEAQSELKHVREFSDQILAVGGFPVLPSAVTDGIPQYSGLPLDILTHVLKMEQQVVSIFAERLAWTEKNLPAPFGEILHIFYEDQIMDSHKTVHEVQMMLQKG
jgi:bacterioferritin (cytochrome b1)